jgi:hypothetical protein
MKGFVYSANCTHVHTGVIREEGGLSSYRIVGGTIMRPAKVVASILGVLSMCGMVQRVCAQGRNKRIVIAASTVLDGKGGVLRDARIVVEGAKIATIESRAGGL